MKPRTVKSQAEEDSETATMKEVVKLIKDAVQAAAVRLQMDKIEKEAKARIFTLMKEHGVPQVASVVVMDGRKIDISATLSTPSSTSIDIDKLATMLTPEQLRACSKVTLTAAREVLPQGLIDQASVVTEGSPVVKLSASKGFPVPEVKLFK